MRILVIGAGVIGSIYAARLTAAGHDVRMLARGPRHEAIDRGGLNLHTRGQHLRVRPKLLAAAEAGSPVDLTIIAVRATQLDSVLGLLELLDSPAVAFLSHLGPLAGHVHAIAGAGAVVAFPGVGGLIRADGSVEYVEIAAQPTTIDAAADQSHVLRTAIRSTGMRTAMEPDMPAWLATHEVFVSCLGSGILSRGGQARNLAAELTTVLRHTVRTTRPFATPVMR